MTTRIPTTDADIPDMVGASVIAENAKRGKLTPSWAEGDVRRVTVVGTPTPEQAAAWQKSMRDGADAPIVPTWRKGTDLRRDGRYEWPPLIYRQPDDVVESYPSVTSVLDETSTGFMRAQFYFIGKEVADITAAAKAKAMYPRWDAIEMRMVDCRPIDLLLEPRWIADAGWREMSRRANRGTVVHDAVEEWALGGLRVDVDDPHDLSEYVAAVISRNNVSLEVDYCISYVRTALAWCEQHVEQVLMAEGPVFSPKHGYAGTCDLDLTLRGKAGIGRVDVKTSKDVYPAFELQLAAYANAELVGIKGTDTREPLQRPDWVATLLIGPEEAKLREWKDDTDTEDGPVLNRAFDCFLHLLAAHQYMSPVLGDDGKKHSRRPVTAKGFGWKPEETK